MEKLELSNLVTKQNGYYSRWERYRTDRLILGLRLRSWRVSRQGAISNGKHFPFHPSISPDFPSDLDYPEKDERLLIAIILIIIITDDTFN
jgi:hypothetical protein